MDFFESQELARRNTKILMALFAGAIVVLVMLTQLLVLVIARYFDPFGLIGVVDFNWETLLWIGLIVVTVIGAGSLSRVASLRRGGSAVAEILDGRLLVSGGGDLNHQQLLNVVEEMAIASGMPVPQVYLIPDPAINAFAAGYSIGDATIGVTEGAVEQLSRDELQGVIGHEFSHILNGDMRLNIQMIGALYGIYMLSVVGRVIVSPGASGDSSRSRLSGSSSIIGIGFLAVGYLGQLFGRLIKAAVSRQREFLADASAVQFTRNPAGIADALKRIGGYPLGSVVANPKSEEVSHAFFSTGINVVMLFSTHPKLNDRIRRIQPWWNGKYLDSYVAPVEQPETTVQGFANTPDAIVDTIGDTPETVSVQKIKAGIPSELWRGVHEPYVARAVVYLLLLDHDAKIRLGQLSFLEDKADFGVHDTLLELMAFYPVDPRHRLVLTELALPALRQLSCEQYQLFNDNINALIRANGKMSISEWALRKLVTRQLAVEFQNVHSRVRYKHLRQVAQQCRVLLSILTYCDHQHPIAREKAFAAGRTALGLDITLLDRTDISLTNLDSAVDELASLTPLRKPKLLKACVATVIADGEVTATEEELVRSVSNILDCPMPPIDNR